MITTTTTIKTIFVIGLGLIGSSFAKALKKNRPDYRIIGYDQDALVIDEAVALGVIDSGVGELEYAVNESQVIMIAVPMLSIKPLLERLSQWDLSSKIITDVGSCKGFFINAVHDVFGTIPANIVPGHPIAGSEKSGVKAAKADLFIAHNVLLTPLTVTSQKAVEQIRVLWEQCGALVSCLTANYHDQVLALTSHLPQYIAFSLMDTLGKHAENKAIFQYAAGGLLDFTRVASSNSKMWHDIALANKNEVLQGIERFQNGLSRLSKAIEQEDSKKLLAIFERAGVSRAHFTSLLSRREYIAGMNDTFTILIAKPGGRLSGSIRVPGDKSISHRSIILGALAEGVTIINGILDGEDVQATLQAFKAMGVNIERRSDRTLVIHGVGMQGLQQPLKPLHLGNAGTAMRLMAGLLAAQPFDSILVGDDSLSSRPMNRVVKPLLEMGATITAAEDGTPPLKIAGGASLKGYHYTMPVASAQVQSCLLLAGMYANGKTSITSPGIVRDHTYRMLKGFGYPVNRKANSIEVNGGGKLTATSIDVPADISSAAFFMVAATIAEGSKLLLSHVGINPTRSGIIDILRLMGANIIVKNEYVIGGEPVADILIQSSPLKGIEIPRELVSVAIDEFPALFIAAAVAEGKTLLTGAKELRVKESDRIQSMANGLQVLGVNATPLPDGMIIEGGRSLRGGVVDSYGDHRIAMAFAIAALKAESEIRILDCANVATSFPNFVELSSSIGINIFA